MSEIELFEIDSEVMLKSEGTYMRVKEILDGSYICYWNDSNGDHQESNFAAILLTKYIEPALGADNIYIG